MECTPRQLVAHPYAYGAHGPGRRQFSVLCYRGWCDSAYRDREIAAMLSWMTGQPQPPPGGLPARQCEMPGTCECECHDEMKAAMSGQITATAAAVYTRRRGFSLDHAVLDRPLTTGRFHREAGEALCKPAGEFWGASPKGTGTVDCPECLTRARRYGVMVP